MTHSTSSGRALGLGALLLALAGAPAWAQTRTVKVLTAEGVQRVLSAAEAEAKAQKWNVSIAVVDASGDLLAFVRRDGAAPSTIDVAQAKARTSARFRRPTARFDSLAAGRPGLLSMPNMLALEGGVPIELDGEVIGAVGVSGVTSQQDAQIARAGAAAITSDAARQ